MRILENKVAVVLGASSPGNIGQAIARRFLDEGAKVVVSGRKREPLERFAADHGCASTPCDITNVAEAAVWLASDRCFMTGQNLQVNGGLTLRRNPRLREIQAAVATARK